MINVRWAMPIHFPTMQQIYPSLPFHWFAKGLVYKTHVGWPTENVLFLKISDSILFGANLRG
ncbi:hypothetical protein MTR_0318s0010 [Medicago truncatula]|uniref:Uncharacterized protein n=1 Tax=Medicago truncatula TaxID=3880 RepID=A0A072TFV4_MEDTR|nr:hypothetical protein MTR_0318s0010 [Medicago truncatula]